MANPFEQRATEYLRDNSAFLSVVTPEPLHSFFEKHAISGSIYDRLCVVIGTPGSGKTTIARLMTFATVYALINSPNHTEYRPLRNALSKCKVIKGNSIEVLGCRIPMESEYRDFWELPYAEDVKLGLLKSFLQARALISWINSIKETSGYEFNKMIINYRDNSSVAQSSIGGVTAEDVLNKAKEVERAIYSVSAALVPPSQGDLPSLAIAPYHPFDTIDNIVVSELRSNETIALRPLVMLDDVHTLHPDQLLHLRGWLARREMRISRWMLMRLDAQTPESVLQSLGTNSGVDTDITIKKSRETTSVWLQSSDDRATNRRNFRTMAKSMADKYLKLMSVFHRQGIAHFQNILSSRPTPITDSQLVKLKKEIDILQSKNNIHLDIRDSYETQIEQYFSGIGGDTVEDDVKLAMLRILLNRYVKRVPQAGLFEDENTVEPSKPMKVDASVADGAKIFLLHKFKRPYYYGVDAVCDASSENAEQFLQLAGQLVSASEARIIRNSSSELSSKYQHQLLQKKSIEIVREWMFPRHTEVRKICEYIATQCLSKSLEDNASLGGGANAFGIPNEEFDCIARNHPDFAHVLKFGVAYSALSIKRHHKTKKRLWTLIELTGPFLIMKGLTLSRGGFLERKLSDLTKIVEEE